MSLFLQAFVLEMTADGKQLLRLSKVFGMESGRQSMDFGGRGAVLLPPPSQRVLAPVHQPLTATNLLQPHWTATAPPLTLFRQSQPLVNQLPPRVRFIEEVRSSAGACQQVFLPFCLFFLCRRAGISVAWTPSWHWQGEMLGQCAVQLT